MQTKEFRTADAHGWTLMSNRQDTECTEAEECTESGSGDVENRKAIRTERRLRLLRRSWATQSLSPPERSGTHGLRNGGPVVRPAGQQGQVRRWLGVVVGTRSECLPSLVC